MKLLYHANDPTWAIAHDDGFPSDVMWSMIVLSHINRGIIYGVYAIGK